VAALDHGILERSVQLPGVGRTEATIAAVFELLLGDIVGKSIIETCW
jgi:hypothetical protein